MKKHEWGTYGCQNNVNYYNEIEVCYYCKHWAIHWFKEGDWLKIGNLDTIKQLFSLWKCMLDELKEYIVDVHLEIKWSLILGQQRVLSDELDRTNNELNNILKDNKLKDLSKIQQRTSDLKSKIIDSEAFSKYL